MSDKQAPAPAVYPASRESASSAPSTHEDAAAGSPANTQPREIGGYKGPEPTRFGDWEKNGRCIDF